MKLITWNCNMAFRKKTEPVLALKPDILIIPECEHPSKFLLKDDVFKPTDTIWLGTNQNKGLGIFSFSNSRFRIADVHNENLRMIAPIEVTGGDFDFNLFAIWAHNPHDPEGQYIEQVYKAAHFYSSLLTERQTLLIGDFNSNTIWDKKHKQNNHSNLVRILEDKGISSLYHLFYKQAQGKEQHPTYYMYRHKDRPYHIDYCFASTVFIRNLKSVEIGDFDFWMKYSDHVPLIVELDFPGLKDD
jgi:exodeoxyribonuclease III